MFYYKLGELIPKLKTRVGKPQDLPEETKKAEPETVSPQAGASKQDKKKKKKKK